MTYCKSSGPAPGIVSRNSTILDAYTLSMEFACAGN